MTRRFIDPTDDALALLRSELEAAGYDGQRIELVVAWHERHRTFRGCPYLDDLGYIQAEAIMGAARPMGMMEGRGAVIVFPPRGASLPPGPRPAT